MTNADEPERKRVKFAIEAASGSDVFVAGTFNNWDARKNRLKMKDGKYTTSILLAKGRYEYKFLIDGIWCVDPACQEWTPNSVGSLNSVITVQ